MFDWLKELFQAIWGEKPWFVLDEYERGVRLRFGKYKRPGIKFFKWRIGSMAGEVLGPGFHWKIPFVDSVPFTQVVPTTLDLSEQTVTTLNNVQLVLESTVKYEVEDAVKLLLEVRSAADALADMAKGIIRKEAVKSDWPDTNGEEFERVINRKIKAEAKRWGIKVHEVSITSMAQMLSIRLLQTSSWKQTDVVKD